MCPGEEESSCFDRGTDQTWGHRFYTILFRVLLQDLPASLMSSAALSLCSRAICQKDRMHYVRTLVVFLQNSSWIFHPLFIKKKKNKVSLFSSTSFPSTLPLTVWPMMLFWTGLWGLKLLWVLRPLPLPAIISSWNASCARVKISERQCWRKKQWQLIQCLYWKQDCFWRIYL